MSSSNKGLRLSMPEPEPDRVFDDADSPELTRAKNEYLRVAKVRRFNTDAILEQLAYEGCLTVEDFEKKTAWVKEQDRVENIETVARSMRDRGFPRRHLDTIVAAFIEGKDQQVTDALAKARAFAAETGRCLLVLSGGTGVGKTHAAVSLTFELEVNGRLGYNGLGGISHFIAATDLAKRAGFDHEAQWRELEQSRLLVIDDYGAEFADGKGWLAAAFDGLINHRYADCRLTVITTNLDAAAFKSRAGERIADRIVEAGRFVVLAGESLRRRKAG